MLQGITVTYYWDDTIAQVIISVPWRCNINGESTLCAFWYKYYAYIWMLFVDVEVDDYFCTVTGSSRQCRCFFCAFHIFRKMFEQTKCRNWLFIKWIPRQPNSGIRFLPWCNQTTRIHFPYEKTISPEIILRLELTFRWTKRTLGLSKFYFFQLYPPNL